MHQDCDVWEALRTLDFVRRRALKPRLLALGLTLGEGQPRILNRSEEHTSELQSP